MNRFVFPLMLVTVSAVAAPLQIRVATFNASLNRNANGQLASDLAVTTNNQAQRIAEIVQRVAPDIILINEFDYDAANPSLALNLFHDNYLAVSQSGQTPLSFPYRYIAPSNTGVPTGKTLASEGDFDNNGSVDTTPGDDTYGNDCFGFGWFPGQYSFAVYSRFPIQTGALRSFRLFLWKNMPGAVFPAGWYTASELNIFRLSSKNHIDLPIEVAPGHVLHLLVSHPTPPAFDGGEDRNGRRNHDEIRLWADYLSNMQYLRDDANVRGGLGGDQRFIVLGDMNADPIDGDSYLSAINQLRNHPLVNASFNPASAGGAEQGAGGSQQGNPAYDTSYFGNGNLRVDHVLPSKLGFNIVGGGVFWPASTDPLYALLFLSASQTQGNQTTDHRLVWLDLVVTPIPSQAAADLVATRQGNDVALTWKRQMGITYVVEQCVELPNWTASPTIPITFDNITGTALAIDANAALGPQKFYRLSLTLEVP